MEEPDEENIAARPWTFIGGPLSRRHREWGGKNRCRLMEQWAMRRDIVKAARLLLDAKNCKALSREQRPKREPMRSYAKRRGRKMQAPSPDGALRQILISFDCRHVRRCIPNT